MSRYSLENKHIVIVGASSGIGREIAIQCALEGASVSICARRKDRLEDTLENMPKANHGYEILDVTDKEQIIEVFDAFVKKRGKIDGLVYSAGILKNCSFHLITPDIFMNVLNVNLIGAMSCTQAATANKRRNPSDCAVVWISSVAFIKPGGGGGFMYAASKGALSSGVKVLALELAKKNVRINTICPAAVETDIWNIHTMNTDEKNAIYKRHLLGIGQPIDVANASIFLLSNTGRWVTGRDIFLDGGYLLT